MVENLENLGIWRPVLELRGNGLLSLPNGSLIFETVSLNHEGMYSCNVDNGVPQPLNKAIWISVKSNIQFFMILMLFISLFQSNLKT